MPSPPKKQKKQANGSGPQKDVIQNSDSSEADSLPEMENIDFEGTEFFDDDFDLIQPLMKQLFPKSSPKINDVIKDIMTMSIKYNIGCAVRSAESDESGDEDENNDSDSEDYIFNCCSVLPLVNGETFKELRMGGASLSKFLSSKCTDPTIDDELTALCSSPETFWLICERSINFPAKVSLASLKSIQADLQTFSKKNGTKFSNFLYISKFMKPTRAASAGNLEFVNCEEEYLFSSPENHSFFFDYSLKGEVDIASKNWGNNDIDVSDSEDDKECDQFAKKLDDPNLFHPFRRVVCLTKTQLDAFISHLDKNV